MYGTLVTSPSPHLPTHLARAGLDFVFIDTEHIPLGRETVAWMCTAYRALNLAPIVRIPSPDPYAASQALDSSAAGVVTPYVETVEHVQALRGAVKYKPLKGKKLDRILESNETLQGDLKDYIDKQNQERLMLVNIESVPAIENLDALLDVPDLDGIVVGPHDLSCSLGRPEQYEHPDFTEALRITFNKSRERGLITGVHFMCCGPVALALEWIRMGVNLIIQHADVVYAAQGVAADVKAMRKALGDTSQTAEGGSIVV